MVAAVRSILFWMQDMVELYIEALTRTRCTDESILVSRRGGGL